MAYLDRLPKAGFPEGVILVESLNSGPVFGTNNPNASRRHAVSKGAERPGCDDLVAIAGQERQMLGHMLLTLGQARWLLRVNVFELNDEQHQQLPSLA